jgi:hypothetical protein
MKNSFLLFAFLFLLVQTSCNQKKNAHIEESTELDTIGLAPNQKEIKKSPLLWANPTFDYASFLTNKQLEAFGHSLPLRFFKDEQGKTWLASWDNFVNFKLDEDCGDKFYYYEVQLDSALANLKPSRLADSYFSPNDYYDSVGKSIVRKEVNHTTAKNGVLFEMNDIHLYFKGNRQDSVVIYQSTLRNVFDNEIELKSIVINLGSRPVEQVLGNLVIKETGGLKDTTTLQLYSYSNINLLEKILPPYSIQMIKKSIPNKHSSKNSNFRYYNDNWDFTTYRIAKSNEIIELKDK